jgi:hypothetical protein
MAAFNYGESKNKTKRSGAIHGARWWVRRTGKDQVSRLCGPWAGLRETRACPQRDFKGTQTPCKKTNLKQFHKIPTNKRIASPGYAHSPVDAFTPSTVLAFVETMSIPPAVIARELSIPLVANAVDDHNSEPEGEYAATKPESAAM